MTLGSKVKLYIYLSYSLIGRDKNTNSPFRLKSNNNESPVLRKYL